ncbi:DUF6221 family protein [Streptomyces sp. NPDC058664]|uniref:DUF6221 family protein n=1 Tax=unclassified Streptomyces TaxID=2593676 RepID=UPI00365AF64B
MDDLIAFLRARLDDDEQTALSWPEDSRRWQTVGGRRLSYRNGSSQTVTAIDISNASSLWNEQIYVKYDLDGAAEHIARQDPARVLAEVDAKRRMVALHEPVTLHAGGGAAHFDTTRVCRSCEPPKQFPETAYPCATLRLMALPYADRHPDYRDAWRP